MNRLFEEIGGLLIEVDQAKREGRRFSSMNLTIDILLSPEEEAGRTAEEAIEADRLQQEQAAQIAREQYRQAALAKLADMGISAEELKAALA